VDSNADMAGRCCADDRDDDTGARRVLTDRRTRPTSPFDALRLRGRRLWPRREQERRGAYFVDRFDALTLAVIVTLLMLTIADGVLTIELLDTNSEEMNPVMARLLLHGHRAFLLGKYVLTAFGLPFIVVYKNYPMFGTRFRIGFLLPIFVGLYVVLIFYQARLLSVGREVTWPLRPNRCLHRVEKSLTGKTTSHQAAMAEWTSIVATDDVVWPNKSQSHISCPISCAPC
jgi:hypothetical protein